MTETISKICSCCKTEKSTSEFGNNKNKKEGLMYICKECNNRKRREWASNNPEAIKAIDDKSKLKHRDKVVTRKREYRLRTIDNVKAVKKAHYAANKESIIAKVSEYSRNNRELLNKAKRIWRRINYYANPGKILAKSASRRFAKSKATPVWADYNKVVDIYNEAKRLTLETGIQHEVDHECPLRSDFVCGLHCEQNLNILTITRNRQKNNKYWSDMWPITEELCQLAKEFYENENK